MKRTQDPIDSLVGQRLRQRRNMLGFSQEKLGSAIGVSFQMVQKYERGDCRVGASRLMKIAQALQTSVSWFFEGAGNGLGGKVAMAEDKTEIDDSMMQNKETLELLKAYYALPEEVRKEALVLMQSLKKKLKKV